MTAANSETWGYFNNGVWDAIWIDGRSELVECQVNSKYVSVLKKGLIPIYSSDIMSKNHLLFMEDEAIGHTAQATQN